MIFLSYELYCLSHKLYCKFFCSITLLDKDGINSVYSLSYFHCVFAMLFLILSHTKYKNQNDFTRRVPSKMIITVDVRGCGRKYSQTHVIKKMIGRLPRTSVRRYLFPEKRLPPVNSVVLR